MPLNYAYPLSAAIYRILSKGNAEYSDFLHREGYGKGFKLFTFSQIRVPFTIDGDRRDRMRLSGIEAMCKVCFYLPDAMEHFIKGLFKSEEIVIADKRSKVVFTVKSIESLPDPLLGHGEREIIEVQLKPLSPIVVGVKKDDGKYLYLEPSDSRFAEYLCFNWRSKIETCYDKDTAAATLLLVDTLTKCTPKSRLMTIKSDTKAETKIRGWMNFGLRVTGEKRFIDLLLSSGVGVYNSQGMGCVEVMK